MMNKSKKSNNRKNLLSAIRNEYNKISQELFKSKYLLDLNGLSEKNTNSSTTEITWSGKDINANFSFKDDISTTELLKILISKGQYSFLFYDYSILQVEYIIENENIIKQRIQYIKNNNTFFTIEFMEGLRIDWLDEGDQFDFLLSNESVPFIVRADYDPKNYIDLEHAKSHMTFSNIENCRIPIVSNISLTDFVMFILRNVFGDFDLIISGNNFNEQTISEREESTLHLNWKTILK